MLTNFAVEEQRKEQLLAKVVQKNEWILNTKNFCFWDIEATNLNASIGRMLCASVFDGISTKTFSNWKTDKKIAVQLRDELEKFDYAVSYNGLRYDLPFLNTRLKVHGERYLAPLRHVDLIWTARSHLRLHSNRLEVVGQVLLGQSGKTKLDGSIWNDASVGDKKSLQYIIEHCEADVVELARIFEELKDFRNLGATPLRGAYYL